MRRGLGLALVRRLVRRAGGSIAVSQGPGRGSRSGCRCQPPPRPATRRRLASGWGRDVIRTLVVDDDFRVARIHAASIERIDGFVCVGEAHSATEARRLIEDESRIS